MTGRAIPGEPPRRLARDAIVDLLAPSLGREKSTEAVDDAAARLGFPRGGLEAAQALALLEALASSEDLVGIVARLAKARLRLLLHRPTTA